MNAKYWFLQGLIGALLGLAALALLEVAFFALMSELFHARIYPRGLAWIALPIIGATFGWKFGRYIGAEGVAMMVAGVLQRFDRLGRLWVSASILWVLCSGAYMLIINPFGRYWYSEDWRTFWLVLVVPIIIAGLAVRLGRWVNKAEQLSKVDHS